MLSVWFHRCTSQPQEFISLRSSHTKIIAFVTQHSTQDQSRASRSTTYAVPTSTARSLSPPADALQITDSVSNAILTPRLNSASPGAERLASVSSIDESASQRLSAVNSALQNTEDRDAGGAQLSPQPAPARDESPGRAALALRNFSQAL